MSMNLQAQASNEYLKNAVLTATPAQLQLMLYDGAIRFTARGIEALAATDFEGMFNAFERAQRIVLQLHAGMNRDIAPDLVDQMAGLYTFIYRRLVDAHLERSPVPAEDALRILRHQRETWVLLMDKIAAETSGAGGEPATARVTTPPASAVTQAAPNRGALPPFRTPFAAPAPESNFSAEV
jgi:flagellar secretion chaperone FliS